VKVTYDVVFFEDLENMEELAFLEKLLPALHFGADTVLGPGDDCAALDNGGPELLLAAADHVIADIHYFADKTPPELAGAKLFNRNASDIAAMGGTPRWALLALAANHYSNDRLLAFARGAAQAAEAAGAALVGGDVSSLAAPGLSASLTILGSVPKTELITRSGARPGDFLCVTGEIGNSLDSGHHLNFRPRLAEGRLLAANHYASAMLDVSDGLLLDALRLCRMSHVRLTLDPAAVPLRAGAKLPDALRDGEDYELLFTVPPEKLAEMQKHLHAAVIGKVCAGTPGITDPAGNDLLTGNNGYEHGKH